MLSSRSAQKKPTIRSEDLQKKPSDLRGLDQDLRRSSWNQISSSGGTSEKEISAIQSRADARVRKQAARVNLVEKKRDELIAEHQRQVEDRLKDYTMRIDNITGVGDKEIKQHMLAKEQAEVRIESAERCAQKAEEDARELEKQVKRLYVLYDQACADHDRRLVAVRQHTDERVQSKLEESNRVVRDTGLYAAQVQAEGIQYMTELEGFARAKTQHLEDQSLGRSRFKELYDVALSRGNFEIPESDFQAAKTTILQDWNASWQEHANELVAAPESISPGFRDVYSSLSNHDTIGPEDILDQVSRRARSCVTTPDMARSKEREVRRASEHQHDEDRVPPECLVRPKTALF